MVSHTCPQRSEITEGIFRQPVDSNAHNERQNGACQVKNTITGNAPSPIGGFFEIELPRQPIAIHRAALKLSTGRSCLLAALQFMQPARCYAPHYTCDAALQPLKMLGIDCVLYCTDRNLVPQKIPKLNEDECILLTNYFGLQRQLTQQWSEKLGPQLIVDNTHDFFHEDSLPTSWSFTSARKYFGVPDGAFLNVPEGIINEDVVPNTVPAFTNVSLQHSLNRKLGKQEAAFADFQRYEESLPCSILKMSDYSRAMLGTISFPQVAQQRRDNFQQLANALRTRNAFSVSESPDATPFAYPYQSRKGLTHADLHQLQIYAPQFWKNVLDRQATDCPVALEYSRSLIPLPVDHRYGRQEMQRIIDTISTIEDQK